VGASHGFSPRPVEPLDWRTTPSPRCDGYAFNEPASGGHTSDIMDLALRIGGIGVNELIARVEVEDFDTWLQVHRSNAEHRSKYGMTDGPIYRDIDDPSASSAVVRFRGLQASEREVDCCRPRVLHRTDVQTWREFLIPHVYCARTARARRAAMTC